MSGVPGVPASNEEEKLDRENRIEACKTYIEQTKLLVTLASAFILAPAAVIALDPAKLAAVRPHLCLVLAAECEFVASVLAGYFVLATVAGSQSSGTFDVYRPATRVSSIVQIITYLLGLAHVAWLISRVIAGAG
jgi:hypothetical protein